MLKLPVRSQVYLGVLADAVASIYAPDPSLTSLFPNSDLISRPDTSNSTSLQRAIDRSSAKSKNPVRKPLKSRNRLTSAFLSLYDSASQFESTQIF